MFGRAAKKCVPSFDSEECKQTSSEHSDVVFNGNVYVKTCFYGIIPKEWDRRFLVISSGSILVYDNEDTFNMHPKSYSCEIELTPSHSASNINVKKYSVGRTDEKTEIYYFSILKDRSRASQVQSLKIGDTNLANLENISIAVERAAKCSS
mmetsp:Transcript_2560/g.3902  ORF Transcript_2560/g.3902 Transcript_2560/m.3902 type:complete len:151 (-) Transcript_2560:259-711(-)|eukprot:CAMPEP_0185026254 /NCGR_PEP_ID=MMETSP1103-20130426/10184_1 /TAXON_ID=36769 /ORGANISM="Paraphysomonas bandaiensis, Strain Caron Lab Isolate" /LENGTH=150 /DNA_ID=CAMNT_0027559765 /DNA_START=149 /DNA_END=601 /DNA_ORIENTATION=-